MEEILEKIEKEISEIKEEKSKLDELTTNSEQIRNEKEKLEQERATIGDAESGFYKDLTEQIDEKETKFTELNNERMHKDKQFKQLVSDKKEQIKNEILAKKQYIDENRKVNMEELAQIDVIALKEEKEKLEKQIELNNTTKEEFLEMSDSEKKEVKHAKEQYLNNKHRLNEINPTIELIDTLDGKTPKDKYMEFDNLEKLVDESFDINNLDKMVENVENIRKEKQEEIEEMQQGKTSEPENNKSELTQEEKIQEETSEPENDKSELAQEEKIEQVKKEIEAESRDYKNIDLSPNEIISENNIKEALNKNKLNNHKIKDDLPNDLAIEIGRTGKITLNGQTYFVGKEIIKSGVNMPETEVVEFIMAEQIGLKNTKEVAETLKECIDENLIDGTVIHMISEVKMPEEDKKKIMKQYIKDAFNVKTGKAFKNNCNITYREDDLSKTNILSSIFGKEVDSNEKMKLIDKARTGNRFSIANIKGEYKPNRITKIMNWFKGINTPKLPTMEDMQIAATEWNQLDKKGETSKVNSYLYMRDLNLTDMQKQELYELHDAQVDQKISKEEKRNIREELNVDNENNIIERKAEEILKEQEQARKEAVKEMVDNEHGGDSK